MAMNISQVSSMASSLFAKLDTKKQGYFELSDLKSAFETIQDQQSQPDEVFAMLDGNGDGKVTQSELTSSMQSVADSLDAQFNDMRMSMAMAGSGMMPPPPPQNDTGFSKDELSSQLEEIGSSDSKRASLISSIVANFDQADADGDGKVSFREAMAYDQSNSSASATGTVAASTGSSGSSGTTSSRDEEAFLARLMQLMQAYGQQAEAPRHRDQGGLSITV